MAKPIWPESIPFGATSSTDVHRWPGAAIGMRERGQPDAGSIGRTSAGNRYSHVTRGEPMAASAATAGGKPYAVAGRRCSRVVYHLLDSGNAHDIHACDRRPSALTHY